MYILKFHLYINFYVRKHFQKDLICKLISRNQTSNILSNFFLKAYCEILDGFVSSVCLV